MWEFSTENMTQNRFAFIPWAIEVCNPKEGYDSADLIGIAQSGLRYVCETSENATIESMTHGALATITNDIFATDYIEILNGDDRFAELSHEVSEALRLVARSMLDDKAEIKYEVDDSTFNYDAWAEQYLISELDGDQFYYNDDSMRARFLSTVKTYGAQAFKVEFGADPEEIFLDAIQDAGYSEDDYKTISEIERDQFKQSLDEAFKRVAEHLLKSV